MEDIATEDQGQPNVTVTTEDVLGCLHSSRSSLTLEAAELWLRLAYTGNRSGSPRLHAPSTCWLQVTGRGDGVMSLLVLRGTCFTDNRLTVHSRTWNGLGYDCDPTAWVAPGVELVLTSNFANVSVEVNDVGMPCSWLVQFKLVPERSGQLLAMRRCDQEPGCVLSLYYVVTFKVCCHQNFKAVNNHRVHTHVHTC